MRKFWDSKSISPSLNPILSQSGNYKPSTLPISWLFSLFSMGKHVAEGVFKHKNRSGVMNGTLQFYERERYKLSKCSLVRIDREGKALSIEPLIQDAVLSRMSPERCADAYAATIRLLSSAWPFPESRQYHGAVNSQSYETVIHHIYRLPEHAQDQRTGRLNDVGKGEIVSPHKQWCSV